MRALFPSMRRQYGSMALGSKTSRKLTGLQSFVFNDSAHGARLFGLKEFGNIYSRIMNVGCLESPSQWKINANCE